MQRTSPPFIAAAALLCAGPGVLCAQEEFAGPLAGWKNLKTDYGAAGDGVADDTAALQKGLDDLRRHERHCVLYIPAGTYRIVAGVRTERAAHHECMGIGVIGEDPERAIIRWAGPAGGTMFTYNAWYSTISRLTLDGAGTAETALAYGGGFSTYNETSDMIFKDARVGMRMATGDQGQAENEVLRCRFVRCAEAGLLTANFNSMDIWVWHSLFEGCGYGLFNAAGNFHAYENVFLGSKKADIGTANLMVFSFVNNTSIGSACFMDFAGGHTWGSPASVTRNMIIEPTGERAIRLGNSGPFLVADNVIKSRAGAAGPVVELTWGDQTLAGNTYTVENPVKEAGRFLRFGERIVPRESIAAPKPLIPRAPPRREGPSIDVRADDRPAASLIQFAIDFASRERQVVHLPKGTYEIDQTIVVPGGSDVQIVGDGAAETATVLRWIGDAGGPMFRLRGPSRATLRDLHLSAGKANGILIEGCDAHPGGRVFADQLNVTGLSAAENGTGVLVNGVEESDVLFRCLQGGSFCATWVSVVGGVKRRAGKDAPGQVSVFAGATGTADAQYHVSRGGRLLVRGVYHEVSGAAPQGIGLEESGELVIDSTRFSYKTSPEKPLVSLAGFRGRFAILSGLLLPVDSPHPARIEIAGDGSACEALCMNNVFWATRKGIDADMVWRNLSTPPARGGLVNCILNGGPESGLASGFGRLENRGDAGEEFILRMLEPLRRARLWHPEAARDEKATNVTLHRIICSCGAGAVGLELRP